MKIIVFILLIFFVLIIFKMISGRNNINNKKYQKETTIDLEKDPKTKEYKPKE